MNPIRARKPKLLAAWDRSVPRQRAAWAFVVLLVTARSSFGANESGNRAIQVQQSIQQRFWDNRRQMYLSKAGHDGPAEMWAAGIATSSLDVAARYQPNPYRSLLLTYISTLDHYWDRNEKIPGYEPYPTDGRGNDKYYDDNAWMAITFCEAYAITRDPRVLGRARATTDFVLSGWDDQLGGGIWWHERHNGGAKNTCANGPAAVACLRLAPLLSPAAGNKYRTAAVNIVAWTRAHLQNDNGLFGDNINVATGKVNRGSLTYNTALMIDAQLLLFKQTGRQDYLTEAERESKASDFYVDSKTHGYHDAVKWSHLLVEADLLCARNTKDSAFAEHLRQRAKSSVDADFNGWLKKPSEDLIDVAGLARELWLITDLDTEAGRTFWQRYDALGDHTK